MEDEECTTELIGSLGVFEDSLLHPFKPRADTQAWDFKTESGSQFELMV